MDADNDGIVSHDELKAGLAQFGSHLIESEVQMLIEAVDSNGKGTLDYGEFLAVSHHLQRMTNDEHLRRAFSYFDKDGNGFIELEELQKENGGSKDIGHSILNSINKSTSQIKKPSHRENVYPKWADSFLKRKIKHLQEIARMNLSLDKTLGNANPHCTRIAREKIAAGEADQKAMEARKAALVEASWLTRTSKEQQPKYLISLPKKNNTLFNL